MVVLIHKGVTNGEIWECVCACLKYNEKSLSGLGFQPNVGLEIKGGGVMCEPRGRRI